MLLPALGLLLCLAIDTHAYTMRSVYRPDRGYSSSGKAQHITGDFFGFEEGGSFQFAMDCDGPAGPLSVVAVTQSQESDLEDNMEKPCSSILQFSVVFDLRNYTVDGYDPSRPQFRLKADFGGPGRQRFYKFFVRECPPIADSVLRAPRAKCDVMTMTLNPHGEHLSRDETSIPTIYEAFVYMWAAALVLWAINWAVFRKISNRLHRLIALPPLLKLVTLCFELKKYQSLSSDGSVPDNIDVVRRLFVIGENSSMFAVLILIAHGWCIIEYHLETETKVAAIVMSTVFFLSSILTDWVHGYFLGITIIVVIVIAVSVLKHSARNIAFLRERREMITTAAGNENPQRLLASIVPLMGKRHLLAASRVTFSFYAFLWAVLGVLSTFLDENKWVEVVLFEGLEACLYLRVLWLFRLSWSHRRIVLDQERSQRKKVQRSIKVLEVACAATPVAICVPLTQDEFMHYVEHEARQIKEERERRARATSNPPPPPASPPQQPRVAEAAV